MELNSGDLRDLFDKIQNGKVTLVVERLHGVSDYKIPVCVLSMTPRIKNSLIGIEMVITTTGSPKIG